MMIRPVKLSDAQDICNIYNEYVTNTRITFEEKPVTVEEMENRIKKITEQYPWLVYEESNKIIGYTYASKWKERPAYRHSVETGIYIASNNRGTGIGSQLKAELIKELSSLSIHCIICGIALPNPASVALCEKFGFQKVAQFKEVGFKLDKWVDVGYWELILQ
jgi:L-amino acid N-acyltransferase YncA